MKKFIEAFRELKSISKCKNPKLCWNKNEAFLNSNPYLVTILFSDSFLNSRNIEVIHKLN